MTKQPLSCSLRKVLRLSLTVAMDALLRGREEREPATFRGGGTMPFRDGGHRLGSCRLGRPWRSIAGRSKVRPSKRCWREAVDSVDFDALEEAARAKMPPPSFAFCAAGADDEISMSENIAAWRALRLRPRVLRDVTITDTRVTLLGKEHPSPILIAPTGRHKLFHPQGERET